MYIEIAPRKRKGAASNRAQALRASKRSTTTRLFEMGAGPDRWGRWKVDHIKEVRRVRGGTRHRGNDRLQARVRWYGTNPNTGMTWRDEWKELYAGSPQKPEFNKELMKEARHLEHLKYGTRIEVRRAGPPEVAQRPKRARKWRAALRGADAGDDMLSGPYHIRRGGVHLIDESDDDEERGKKATRREAALRGIRRMRAESSQGGEPTGSERARARSRQRRARAIEDESTDDEGGDDT